MVPYINFNSQDLAFIERKHIIWEYKFYYMAFHRRHSMLWIKKYIFIYEKYKTIKNSHSLFFLVIYGGLTLTVHVPRSNSTYYIIIHISYPSKNEILMRFPYTLYTLRIQLNHLPSTVLCQLFIMYAFIFQRFI